MKSTERFTNRAVHYHAYRPSYAEVFIEDLKHELVGTAGTIADIGSGTGILTLQLLQAGWKVAGVEPNDAMRQWAENTLGGHAHFRSLKGTSETTGLEAKSIDAIIAAQAFHWFEPEATRKECLRILKPDGKVILVWNIRQYSSDFLKAYEEFLHRYSIDYQLVDHQRFDGQSITHFFRGEYQKKETPNPQAMDWQKLWGYYQSCSYALPATHPHFDQSKATLQNIFEQYAKNATIDMLYHTIWYIGVLQKDL